MPEPHWVLQAACRGKPPEWFDADNVRHRKDAMMTCHGCEVRQQCRADVLVPIDVSNLIRLFWKVDLNEPDDLVPVNGVIRGGVVVDY